MKRLFAIALLLASAGVTAAADARAQDGRPVYGAGRGDQDQAREGVKAGRQAPLSRVLASIAARTPGRHLNTSMGDAGGGRPAYFVQWQMPDGRVVVFVVDAESGQILGQR